MPRIDVSDHVFERPCIDHSNVGLFDSSATYHMTLRHCRSGVRADVDEQTSNSTAISMTRMGKTSRTFRHYTSQQHDLLSMLTISSRWLLSGMGTDITRPLRTARINWTAITSQISTRIHIELDQYCLGGAAAPPRSCLGQSRSDNIQR